ncbi:MAG TPA: VOC family protein [Chitinispirillaceae bacterium]|nr:VOC family protein [Chitinispirillaceae bacterium]
MKIDHIAIWSKDIEVLKDFYCTYFKAHPNQKYENVQKQFQSYFLSFDNESRLELMQMPEIADNQNDTVRQYTGFIHIAIAVENEQLVLELTSRLKNDGYEVVSEPRRTGDGYFESCILDPDRNRVEIVASK